MKEMFYTALAVLDWRSRSYWLLMGGIFAITAFSWVLSKQVEKVIASEDSMFKQAFLQLHEVLSFSPFILLAILLYHVIQLFLKDWRDFHHRW